VLKKIIQPRQPLIAKQKIGVTEKGTAMTDEANRKAGLPDIKWLVFLF